MRRLYRAGWGLLLLLGCSKGRIAGDDSDPPRIVCFAGGTAIATPGGERAIETLQPGESVLAFDLRRGRVVTSRVTALHVHAGRTTGRLPVAGGRTLRVTSEHPIFVPGRNEFIPARAVGEGTPLLALSSGTGVAPAVATAFALPVDAAPETVYDLTVDEQHNYFAEGILVHNKSPPPRCSYGPDRYGDCYHPPPTPEELACEVLKLPMVPGPEAARRLARWLWGRDEAEAVAEAARRGWNPADAVKRMAFVDWLLADPRALVAFRSFVDRWLELDDRFARHVHPERWSSFREETERFVWHVLIEQRDTDALAGLFLADYTFVDARLAAHYGLAVDGGAGWTKVKTDQRGGLLAQGAIVARNHTAPGRGQQLHRRIYACSDFPPPPAEGHDGPAFDQTPARAALTAALATQTFCQNCHAIIDGPGWGLQAYDHLGRFRTADTDGMPLDDSGWIAPSGSNRVAFKGRRGLGQALTDLPEARRCLVEHALAHADLTVPFELNRRVYACLSGRWGTQRGFRGLLDEIAVALTLDWPAPDGGLPDAEAPSPRDAAPDAATDAAP